MASVFYVSLRFILCRDELDNSDPKEWTAEVIVLELVNKLLHKVAGGAFVISFDHVLE